MKKIIAITFFVLIILVELAFGQYNLSFSGGMNSSTCRFENLEAISSTSRLGNFIAVSPSYEMNEKRIS